MKKMLQFHVRMNLSKRMIGIFISVLIIIGICIFTNAYAIDLSLSYEENNLTYFIDSFFYTKLILCFLAVFFFAYGMTEKIDFSSCLLLTSNISRNNYIISKIIFHFLILFIYTFIIYLIFIIFGYIYIPGFKISYLNFISFIMIFLIIIIYGLYSLICMLLMKTIFVSIIPFVIFLLTSGWMEENDLSIINKIILFFFPNYSNQYFDAYYGIFHLLFILFLLIIINVFIYHEKDLNF